MTERTNDALFALARDLSSTLADMAYTDECDLDHNGACQAHNYFGEGECPNARAAKLLKNSEAILDTPELDDMDVCNLSGQDLLDALNEAQDNGHYKGWTFSEIFRGGSVLPMTVYDEKQESLPITKHVGVTMTGMRKGSIVDITLAVTTGEGTRYEEFIFDSNRKY